MKELPFDNKLPERIFLVAQNIDNLHGSYFVRGVVIGMHEEQAIRKIEDQIKDWNEDRDVPITFDRKRVKAFELGPLVQRPDGTELGVNQKILSTEDVLSVDIGEDW